MNQTVILAQNTRENNNNLHSTCGKSTLYMNTILLMQVDIIRSNGYPVEEHEVVTEDGYILLLQRIPNRKYTSNEVEDSIIKDF